ncbi:hypothetical protein [Variovorax sp. dw_954]|nr:hypothetical protein [Variovorax sp. dw_954]
MLHCARSGHEENFQIGDDMRAALQRYRAAFDANDFAARHAICAVTEAMSIGHLSDLTRRQRTVMPVSYKLRSD